MRGISPNTIEEKIVYRSIVLTWVFYIFGALYIVGPVLAMTLNAIILWRWYSGPWLGHRYPALNRMSLGVGVWCIGMLMMLLALFVAHAGYDLGIGLTIKSSIGWLKGWALIALFAIVGCCLSIRPYIVVRAMGWLALQTLILIPFFWLAGTLHLPSRLYVSPLQLVGGPGPEFFSVYLYIIDPANHALRWQFMAPWAPAAGMIGDIFFIFSRYEKTRWLRYVMMLTGFLVCIMTGSRMALLFLFVYPPVIWILSRISKIKILLIGIVTTCLAGIMLDSILAFIETLVKDFKSARASSTRVREALGRIAFTRWQDEAPIWGHGIVVKGTHFVEFMPIGSHHTWYGLLYVKGIIGCIGLAMPLLWSMIELLVSAQVTKRGRFGLTIVFLFVFYSFGENLEILSYLFWPASIILGISLREKSSYSSL